MLLVLAVLSGCISKISALTTGQAARQSLQRLELVQDEALILGDYRLPDGKSIVPFSYTPEPEDGQPLTALGYFLLERGHFGLWREINRGTYIKPVLDLDGKAIDYEIANQPGESAAVFERILSLHGK